MQYDEVNQILQWLGDATWLTTGIFPNATQGANARLSQDQLREQLNRAYQLASQHGIDTDVVQVMTRFLNAIHRGVNDTGIYILRSVLADFIRANRFERLMLVSRISETTFEVSLELRNQTTESSMGRQQTFLESVFLESGPVVHAGFAYLSAGTDKALQVVEERFTRTGRKEHANCSCKPRSAGPRQGRYTAVPLCSDWIKQEAKL